MPTDAPNVLILLSDQHNYRYVGYREGGQPVRTPTLDGLAAESTVFDQAYCPVPAGTPSRICTLTGREATSSGAWDRESRLPAELVTIPGTFSAAGYETCLVGSLGVGGDRQFAGFDHRPYGDHTGTGGHQYDPITTPVSRGSPYHGRSSGAGGLYGHRYDPIDPGRRQPDPWQSLAGDAGPTAIPESQRQERIVAEESLAWLREHRHANPDQPWLLCASVTAPHYPLTAPRRHVERYAAGTTEPTVGHEDALDHPVVDAKAAADRTADLFDRETIDLDDEQVGRARAAYAARVDFLDEVLGDLCRSLDAEAFLEDTIVVYASAQGQLVGEHGCWWTGTWHEDATRVPLLVRTPDHRRGEREATRIETPVSLLDLFPTLCSLCGIEPPADFDGADLSKAVRTGTEPDRDPVFVDHLVPRWGAGTEFRTIRDGRHTYVRFRDADDLLFDLAADPHERVEADDEGVRDRLRGRVDATIDFEATADRRERDVAAVADHRMPISKGTSGNTYLLADGRVIDAGSMLYKPDELATHADQVFADWPGSGED